MATRPKLEVADAGATDAPSSAFSVSLPVFEGPFDLLLTLISKHELDIIDVSLAKVTDEFIAQVGELEAQGRLDEVSSFLLVAATLLDIKLASLLPRGEVVDAEDVRALEARDLLLARLLQYRAFKEAATWFEATLGAEGQRITRDVALDARFRNLAPDVRWTLSPADFAALAVLAMTPAVPPTLSLAHLHAPRVSVREQTGLIVARLRRAGQLTFTELIDDARNTGEIVARFLGVLELYRNDAIVLDQVDPLGPFSVRWTASRWDDDQLAALGQEYEG